MYKVLLAAAALVAASTAQFFPGGQPLYGGQCDYQGFLNCQTQQWQGKPEAAQGCVQIQGGGPNCVRQTTVCDQQCVRGYAYQKVNSDDQSCVCSLRDAACYREQDQSQCGAPFDGGFGGGFGSGGRNWQA